MTTIVAVPNNYGYVLALALVATPLLSFVHGAITIMKRKAAKCPYPNAYASAQEMKTNPAAFKFNCAQRAHANFLENAPQTMMSMLVAGLMYPNATVALGLGWLMLRGLYIYGYIFQGKEGGKGRLIGVPFFLFQGGLWALVALSARNLIS